MEDLLVIILVSAVIIGVLALYITAIVDVHRNKRLKLKQRSTWVTMIVLFPIVGSIIYFRWGKNPERTKQLFR